MKKAILLATAAFAFAATPAYAEHVDASATLTTDMNLSNNIDTSVVTSTEFNSNVLLNGTINVRGTVDVDAAAVAVSDSKQITDGNAVLTDRPDGEEDSEDGAFIGNVADAGTIAVDGNAGVNAAAGNFNTQANIGTIAVATGGGDGDGEDGDGAMAQANTTGVQSLTGIFYGPADEDGEGYVARNGAFTGTISGNGNVGANAAAGAFNQQQNIMTLAVASDSSLAQATAGVVQFSTGNLVILNDTSNAADAGFVSGAGNFGVNVAAGVGNQQHNSLTVAASGAFGGGAGTGGTGGNGGL
jgi:hypothetical protein